ncbi:hypothetical protein BC832DRAFT_538920 [Gaertneriomyces semiglobifer]|nr:hypothetical protein BC832DRAFT_538920 [Gaertneriomyces semiglobifer]
MTRDLRSTLDERADAEANLTKNDEYEVWRPPWVGLSFTPTGNNWNNLGMDFSDLPCDWRISIVHCKRGDVFLTIQKVALFVVSVALIAVIFTLLQRIVFLHGRLWTSAGVSSIEALLALIGLHFIGRIATHVCLIWDALPPTSMSLLWEIPWLVGEIGLQSFVVGVATSSTAAGKWKKSAGRRHSAVSNFILPSKRAVYTAVYTQLAVQVITNVTLAYYAGRYDYSMSVMEWPWRWYHISHYSLWCFYLLLLSAAFIFYSMRLLKELKSASKDLDKLALEESRVQKAVARLRLQFLLVGIIYGSFGLILAGDINCAMPGMEHLGTCRNDCLLLGDFYVGPAANPTVSSRPLKRTLGFWLGSLNAFTWT